MKKKELRHKIKKLAKLSCKVHQLSEELQEDLAERYPCTDYRSQIEQIVNGQGIPSEFVRKFLGEKTFKDNWIYSRQ